MNADFIAFLNEMSDKDSALRGGKAIIMPDIFPTLQVPFFGREDIISRYRARVDHFGASFLVGLEGAGKTSLLLKLAPEVKRLGIEKAVYLSVCPAESISSILGRVEARVLARSGQAAEVQSEALRRLVDLLDSAGVLLILDDLHNLKGDDLTSLVRTLKTCPGNYRILAAMQQEPEIAAMDKTSIHIELIRPMKVETVKEFATALGLSELQIQAVCDDASRQGSSSNPLALVILSSIAQGKVPDEDFLRGLSARSVQSFHSLWHFARPNLQEETRRVLAAIVQIGHPVQTEILKSVFGSEFVESLIQRRLIFVAEGRAYVHRIIGKLAQEEPIEFSSSVAKKISDSLKKDAIELAEPMGIICSGELMAHSGRAEDAVAILASGWEAVRDFGFLQAYLKSLASMPVEASHATRLKVLSARARMRQGNPSSFTEEFTRLAESDDQWTRSRALASLVYIQGSQRNYAEVVKSFIELRKVCDEPDILIESGTLAANSLMRLQDVKEAEKLALELLELLEETSLYEKRGDMHRLVSRVCAEAGRLNDALSQAASAAANYEKSGDLYHAAAAHGYIGDLLRERGDFEEAKESFVKFKYLATKWGDRNLVQIAELADAWVSLDIGDLPHAARLIAEVEKTKGGAPSRRLKRYLAAAQITLEAGRGKHREVCEGIGRVVEMWTSAGQQNIADILRAQWVRSLVVIGKVEKAQEIADAAMARLDPKISGPKVAVFKRESALIKLRQGQTNEALEELSAARALFNEGGNRREEVLTLHRLSHAALDLGDLELATKHSDEVLNLANEIKHERAIALAYELKARLSLYSHQTEEAAEYAKNSMQGLRKLGDDLGTLHVSELLLRSLIASGDLGTAIKFGPKIGAHAERLGIREVRIRAIVLTGVALYRRGNFEAASRCFREVPLGVVSPITGAFMWRLGEAIENWRKNNKRRELSHTNWVSELKRLPKCQQPLGIIAIQQLCLPPREMGVLQHSTGEKRLNTEAISCLHKENFEIFIDYIAQKVLGKDSASGSLSEEENTLLHWLHRNLNHVVPYKDLESDLDFQESEGGGVVQSIAASLNEKLNGLKAIKITETKTGLKLKLPKNSAGIVPIRLFDSSLTQDSLSIIGYLKDVSSAGIKNLQEHLTLSRTALRRELDLLVRVGYVEVSREGRTQVYRVP
ncbi:MAG: hypothetical protein VYA34_14920 [Myxococcota bacterium]|nr:hypothetical protein [Myxococcota bacterium]